MAAITHPEKTMNIRPPLLLGLLAALAMQAQAQEPARQSCTQIREQIQAQTGPLEKPDTELLKKIGARSDCAFTTPEAYRAAFGDRPPAPYEPQREREHHDDDD